MVATSRPATGDGMKRTAVKYGSARVAWLGLFLVGTSVAARAQSLASSENSAGDLFKTPFVAADVMKQTTGVSATAEQAPGDGLQGDFIQRLTRFYWADWTGKLPSSPA